jgi:hypothetical protein
MECHKTGTRARKNCDFSGLNDAPAEGLPAAFWAWRLLGFCGKLIK